MPTQTFFNLPEEKRERIIAAALKEFSENSFSMANIARIVEGAGISRGSFYQYFSDMKDLYKFIVHRIGEVKYKFVLREMAEKPNLDTFSTIKQLYRSGLRFTMSYPQYAAIGNHFFKEDPGLLREIFGEQVEQSGNFFEDLLKKGLASGEINPDIDLKLAAEIFFHLNIALVDSYLAKRKGGIIEEGEGYLEVVDKMLYIIAYGMKKR